MSLYLGIDFGTCTNVVTRWNENRKIAEPVLLGEYGSGSEVFPNVIFYESAQNFFVGREADRQRRMEPLNGVVNIKRDLEKPDFRRPIPALGRSLSSEEIASNIFSWIKRETEKNFGGEQIGGVVISVPFAFQNRERKRIERAAQEAGLNVLGLIEEPVAAALSFGLFGRAEVGKKEKVLVFDLGGGTFDVTIFDFIKFTDQQFEIKVLSTDGDKHLGGVDIDDLLVDRILDKLSRENDGYIFELLAPEQQKQEVMSIQEEAIRCKEALSEDDEFDLFFSSNFNDELIISETISADDLKDWLQSFCTKITNTLNGALTSANLRAQDIDRIILVGGSSNIPVVKSLLESYFKKPPEESEEMVLMVGKGAGIYCGLKYVTKKLDCKISVGVS